MIRWDQVIAVLGGTFDPPHLGHREAALGLLKWPGVQRVLILPTPAPPHKPCFASTEDRIAMLHLCFQKSPPAVQIDLSEVERATGNGGTFTYSFDTLQELSRRTIHGSDGLAFVIGADQLAVIDTWYRFPDLLDSCNWIVLARKPGGMETAREALRHLETGGLAVPCEQGAGDSGTWYIGRKRKALKLVTTEAPDISSTRIREAIGRTGSPPTGLLDPDVEAYLKLKQLYGSNQT